jgi:hypothetical protein
MTQPFGTRWHLHLVERHFAGERPFFCVTGGFIDAVVEGRRERRLERGA